MKTLIVPMIAVLFVLLSQTGFSQKEKKYSFKDLAVVKHTSVKDQSQTGTCWSFAATSFIEAEILREKNIETDISEMYFVRNAYITKADKYIRYHGKNLFTMGGQAHDVIDVIKSDGMAPESDYVGLAYKEKKHNHAELHATLNGFLKGLSEQESDKLTPVWKEAFVKILDTYLGQIPNKVSLEEEKISPVNFASRMGINADNYIELSSYTHHPFYKQFELEVPDNWSHNDDYYNVPLEELVAIVDHAIENNYSVCWDGDVGNNGFRYSKGVATAPSKSDSDESEEELTVTQELRQAAFDNHTATDDHLMHLIGTATDKDGKRYFIIKNSWGEKSNSFSGKLYMSEDYFKLYTLAIMINKKALPEGTASKLKIK